MSVEQSTTITKIEFQGIVFSKGWDDGRPRARDVDLARGLGYTDVENFRHLIREVKSDIESGPGDFRQEYCSVKSPGGRGRPSKEFWLTIADFSVVSGRSRQENAAELSRKIGDVFERFILDMPQQVQFDGALFRKPEDWTILWTRQACASLAKVLGKVYSGGRIPRYLFPLIGEVYRWALGDALYFELKARNPNPCFRSNHHLFMRPEIKMPLMAKLPEIVAAAETSSHHPDPKFVFRHLLGMRGYEHVQLPMFTMQPALSA